MSHFSLILLQQRKGLWSGFVNVKAESTFSWRVICRVEGRGKGALSLQQGSVCSPGLCLDPSIGNAKPGGCKQAQMHHRGDQFDVTSTMMNITFWNGNWCVRLSLGSNSKIQCRLTPCYDRYSG